MDQQQDGADDSRVDNISSVIPGVDPNEICFVKESFDRTANVTDNEQGSNPGIHSPGFGDEKTAGGLNAKLQ